MALGKRELVITSIRVLFGAMWVYVGLVKLVALDVFAQDVRNYKFAPFDQAPADMWLAYGLPWLEVIVGVAMLLGYWKKACTVVSIGMFGMFVVAVSHAWKLGLNTACGCFGQSSEPINYPLHMAGLVVGLLVLLVLFFADRKRVELELSAPEGSVEDPE